MAVEAGEQEAQEAQRRDLRRLTKTDPDPRVRRRAQALLLVEHGQSTASVARLFHTSAYRVHVWEERFSSAGREGLADRSRGGRPPKLTADDRAFVEEALDRGPQAYGLPITVWTLRDLQALLQRERGVAVSVVTVHRVVHALGFRSRRPRHDLTHRQDRAAVAAAKQVLDWLQKKQLLSPSDPLLTDSIWSTWTSAKSMPTPTWQRSGGAKGSR
jgi:transposase